MIVDVHTRIVATSLANAAAVLESLSGENDRLWSTRSVAPMVLDNGLTVGSRGGHGPIRYAVSAHVPGRSVEFTFDPQIGLVGTHLFAVDQGPANTVVFRHELRARAQGAMRVLWPVIVRPIHHAVIHDSFDKAERDLTGAAHRTWRTRSTTRWLASLTTSRGEAKADSV